jgi:hypothetical protein
MTTLMHFTKAEDGTKAVVAKTLQGFYAATLWDTDADQVVGTRIYLTLADAEAYARKLVGKEVRS